MISIGTDIIEIERIQRSFDRFEKSFVSHILSQREQELLAKTSNVVQFLAGRFAAKEAIYKALMTNASFGVGWKEMEVLKASNGSPRVELSGRALLRSQELKISKILISLSHCKTHAIAFVSCE